MVLQLGVAIDVRTAFRNERDLLIQLLRNLDEPEWDSGHGVHWLVCARRCRAPATRRPSPTQSQPRPCRRPSSGGRRVITGPTLPLGAAPNQHWQLGFPGDDLEAMRSFCDQVDQQVHALLA